MADRAYHLAKGTEYEKKAEKKFFTGCFSCCSEYHHAANLFEKAGHSYKLAKAYDEAARTYVKLADCHLRLDCEYEAASAYEDAATCYKISSNSQEAVRMLKMAVNIFEDMPGYLNEAAEYYEEIADIYKEDGDIERAMIYLGKAAGLYIGEGSKLDANRCKRKAAKYAARLQQMNAREQGGATLLAKNAFKTEKVDEHHLTDALIWK